MIRTMNTLKRIRNIIVVGYPKSGNTWITRLVSELTDCPVAGFWGSKHREIAIEGQDRASEFCCFKSHHQLNELGVEVNNENRIIYVVRDPRDIAISGANYFRLDKFKIVGELFAKIPKGKSLYNKIIYKITTPENYRIWKMIDAILYGSNFVDHWCRISWKNHYTPYLNQDVLFVRYEDMLSSPQEQCRKIMKYLNLFWEASFIEKAIWNQSFDKKKREFLKRDEVWKANFLRVGKSGQWESKFSEKQKMVFLKYLYNELVYFSYKR